MHSVRLKPSGVELQRFIIKLTLLILVTSSHPSLLYVRTETAMHYMHNLQKCNALIKLALREASNYIAGDRLMCLYNKLPLIIVVLINNSLN